MIAEYQITQDTFWHFFHFQNLKLWRSGKLAETFLQRKTQKINFFFQLMEQLSHQKVNDKKGWQKNKTKINENKIQRMSCYCKKRCDNLAQRNNETFSCFVILNVVTRIDKTVSNPVIDFFPSHLSLEPSSGKKVLRSP